MAGIIFMISLVSILITVGFIFACMVRLASSPEHQESAACPPAEMTDLTEEACAPKH